MIKMCGKCRTVNENLDDFCFSDNGCNMDEEFYSNDISSPSEDIWKKFELPPTPPRSPTHEPASLCGDELSCDLSILSQNLSTSCQSFNDIDSDITQDCIFQDVNLQANLIQDCMWSAPGLAAAGLTTTDGSKSKHKLSLSDMTNKCKVPGSSLDIMTSECVDPAAVFPYPLNDRKKLPCLGVETPSESEDTEEEEEEEEENEEEEIDVVSVSEQQSLFSSRPIAQAPAKNSVATSMSAQVAAMHNYSSNHHQSSSVKLRLSYSAPQTPSSRHIPGTKRSHPSSGPTSPQSSSKRQKLLETEKDLHRVVQKLNIVSQHHRRSCTSRNSSDSEDSEGKRAQHNVLERKRRNDLKSNFLRLRDNVPDISSQERAPKVVILKKSADYIASLTQTHRQLESEREHQKKLQERLKRRLAALNRELL